MRKLERKRRFGHNDISPVAVCDKKYIVLADLVTIFTEEAYKICKNRQVAKIIAVKSLQEYIRKNTEDMKIVL